MPSDKNYAKVIFDGQTIIDLTDTTATQDKVLQGETFHDATGALKTGTYIGGEGTSDYTQLINKPQIAGTTLVGNKTLSDLGIQAAETGKGLSANDYTTAEKTKLAGIATGAEVNQNTFSNIIVGSTTIAAGSKTDAVTLEAGSNITLTPDATNDKITVAATDTTYSPATTSTDGLMSATDKQHMGQIKIGDTWYQSQLGGTPQAGYITFITE